MPEGADFYSAPQTALKGKRLTGEPVNLEQCGEVHSYRVSNLFVGPAERMVCLPAWALETGQAICLAGFLAAYLLFSALCFLW